VLIGLGPRGVHVVPPNTYYFQVTSFIVEDHPNSDPMIGLTLLLLCQLWRDLVLQHFTPHYYLHMRPPGVTNLRSPVISPRGSSLQTIQSLHHTTSQIVWIPELSESQSPSHFTNYIG
jgi:hypothetical protein